MAARKTRFACSACGTVSAKWGGRCAGCDEWNTLVEEAVAPTAVRAAPASTAMATPIGDTSAPPPPRTRTGIGELDRVLGGGLVVGAAVLVGGDPGIGKSTLMLQACRGLCEQGTVLYVSGEEAPDQIRLRAGRLGVAADAILVLAESHLESILAQITELQPRAVVIDSIQTTYSDQIPSAPGSVTQVRETAARLIATAKKTGFALFLVGHVTKEGTLAGPRVLEHMVDTVLYFETDGGHVYRVLRAVKNRFGTTNEIGVFEMDAEGLQPVPNPSEFFLAERTVGATGSVVVASVTGTRPILVEVQALVGSATYGTPRRTAIGFDGNRLSLLLAVLEKRAGINVAGEDIFINIAGGIRLNDPAVDLGVALAVASSHRDIAMAPNTLALGELGLAGEVRAVQRLEGRIKEGAAMGFNRFLVPARQAKSNDPRQIPVATLRDAIKMALV